MYRPHGDQEENLENWGPSTAVVAEYFDWLDGHARIVVPISDDGPCLGGLLTCDSALCHPVADVDAIEKAIDVANANSVHVSPIMGILESEACYDWEPEARDYLARLLADETGGQAVLMSDFADPTDAALAAAFVDAITATVHRACPVLCDDCNSNGVPDEQDIAGGTSEDCNADAVPDECEDAPANLVVIVMGEPPAPLEFLVPPDSSFAFDYVPARLTLWDTPTRDTRILPNDPQASVPQDPDCGADLGDAVEFQVCFTGADGGPITTGCERFDADADDDVDASDFEVFRPLLLWQTCAPVTVYAEGLPPRSNALGDTSITLLLPDPGGDEILATRPVTVAEVTVTPSSSRLGAPVNITVEPAIYPLAFDCRSTVTFDGRYEPLVGDPTADFQVAYNAEQVCELSAGEAVVRIGDGTMTNAPDPTNLSGLGVIRGTLTLTLPAATLKASFNMAPETQLVTWERVYYPDGPGGLGMPRISGAYQSLPVMMLSTTPDPLSPDESYLKVADGYHVAAVVRLQSEATTTATLAYSNTTELFHPISYMTPGSIEDFQWVADDVRLDVPGGCHAIGYEVGLYPGYGGPFDAHVELFEFYEDLFDLPPDSLPVWCPDYVNPPDYVPPEGTGIPGTGMDFTNLPGDQQVSLVYVPVDTDVPERMWVYVSVSTDDAGWVLAEEPEIGSEAIPDCHGGHALNQQTGFLDCTFCFNFDGTANDPLAAMWTQVYCRDTGGAVCENVPSTLLVDLISYDAAGTTEIDRVSGLTLRLQLEDDYDPENIVYHNDLDRPIVLVDVDLNEAEYPEVIPLHVVPGGSAVIVSATE